MAHDAAHYQGLVDAAMAPHRWIVCADVASPFTTLVNHLAEIGAPRPLVLAGTPGTGTLPTPDAAELILLGTTADTMLGGIRAYHAALRHLPEWVIDRIASWDPDRMARVLATFLDTEMEIAGRRSWGARPEAWLRLEDKLGNDAVWEATGVPHVDSEVVPAASSELSAATRRLDRGDGTVWAGDDREGWNGGAEYLRIVADPEDAQEAVRFFAAHCHHVRVMPFLPGVPCSIHGMVFPDVVAAFRPVEMIVFRTPGSNRFTYAGVGTTWDPAPAVREEMRSAARRVGAYLRDAFEYRGTFTMDGIATPEGWRPTELNPRFGAGLGAIGRSSGMPLLGITRMLIAGEAVGELDPAEIEQVSLEAGDRVRQLGGQMMITTRVSATREQRIELADGAVTPVPEGGNGLLQLGPAAMGGLVRLAMDSGAVPGGIHGAPIVRAAFAAADALWGTGIGPLIPATPA